MSGTVLIKHLAFSPSASSPTCITIPNTGFKNLKLSSTPSLKLIICPGLSNSGIPKPRATDRGTSPWPVRNWVAVKLA